MLTNTSNQTSTRIQLCPCGKTNWSELERIHRGILIKIFLFFSNFEIFLSQKKREKIYQIIVRLLLNVYIQPINTLRAK